MSKIGKINIAIPEKVKVALAGNILNIEGPLGKKSLNIDLDIFNLDIKDEVMKEDKGILVDLIKAAHTNAKIQLKTKTSDEITKATGGFGIPGFKWPL